MRDALAAYQRALRGRPHLVCYAMKANSNLAVLQTFAARRLRLRHRLRRRTGARARRRRRRRARWCSPASARPRAEMRAGARRPACAASTSRALAELDDWSSGRRRMRPARAGQPARQSRRRRRARIPTSRPG
ncbi:MAG: hypothetical protein MZW92_63450 [Comamonadaceae bacterium]|nr:hypothetical protein [Comamonadaceae bacterium]